MEKQDIKLPSIEKVKQETIESAVSLKEKKESIPPSNELKALKEYIQKMPVPQHIDDLATVHSQNLQNLSVADKVSKLVEIAFDKGPLTAVATAKKLNDAYILDALHDTLSKDELFNKLITLGKL